MCGDGEVAGRDAGEGERVSTEPAAAVFVFVAVAVRVSARAAAAVPATVSVFVAVLVSTRAAVAVTVRVLVLVAVPVSVLLHPPWTRSYSATRARSMYSAGSHVASSYLAFSDNHRLQGCRPGYRLQLVGCRWTHGRVKNGAKAC